MSQYYIGILYLHILRCRNVNVWGHVYNEDLTHDNPPYTSTQLYDVTCNHALD
jgi:hypothetical protein